MTIDDNDPTTTRAPKFCVGDQALLAGFGEVVIVHHVPDNTGFVLVLARDGHYRLRSQDELTPVPDTVKVELPQDIAKYYAYGVWSGRYAIGVQDACRKALGRMNRDTDD